ncbi:MAG: chemotaxis protein CheW [Gemmatimonadaceae bacterium]
MPSRFLLCRVRDVSCALPLAQVEETMRPLPVEAINGMPPFVRGVAIVRGAPIPVVDAEALLFGSTGSQVTRFVTVKTGSRRVALSVGAVAGIVDVPAETVAAMPPLLKQARDDVVASVGALDQELLLVLSAAKIATDEVWALAVQRSGDTT